MDINGTLQLIGTLLALALSGFSLYKAKKMLPTEQAREDSGAALNYAEAAQKIVQQYNDALDRIEKLESKGQLMDQKVDGLRDVVAERDECIEKLNLEIRQRDEFIADLVAGIKILLGQLNEARITPQWTPKAWKISSE